MAQNPDEISCMATPDQLLGQSFSALAGVVGETADNGITPEGQDIEQELLSFDADWIVNNLVYSGAGTHQVAIIAIDDFSSDGTEEAASHGWLVYEVMTDLVDALPDEVASNIHLEQINIAGENGYRSEQVVTALDDRMAQLSSEGIDRFVLNMSFVIIPCRDQSLGFDFFDFLEASESDPSNSIAKALTNDPTYLQSLLQNTSVTSISEDGFETDNSQGSGPPPFVQEQLLIFQLFENPQLQSDPLRDFLRRGDYFMIPIAASGNFKWQRPFFPARWQEVLSVSALEGTGEAHWSHSNNGEVSVPGAWYQFDDGIYRAGTSLAAPVLSVLTGIDLTQEDVTCSLRGNGLELSSGNFNNTPILDAVERQC